MTFKEEVKDSARGRWIELLNEIGGISRDLLDGKHHHCPRCGGRDRFRLIDQAEGAVLCNQCFSEKNGDGFATIGWMLDVDFAGALDLVARRLGIKKKTRKEKKKPDEVLRFEEWREDRAEWCKEKGIRQETIIAAGGQMADWRHRRVIALPVLGTTAESRPRGYVIVNAMGGTLPCKTGDAKILVTEGSTTGWIGKSSLERLGGTTVVWKVEGVTDQLALSEAIPAEQAARHAVLTNPFGSTEKPKKHLLEVFSGKLVAVVHDPDDAGEKGATRWATAIAAVAKEVRIVRLPGGEDLRDWLQHGGTFDRLREIAREADVIASTQEGNDEDASTDIEVEEDDHMRLANVFFKQRARRFVLHQGAPHHWRDRRWHRATVLDDLRSEVLRFIEQEYNRQALEKAAASAKKDEEPPKRRKINANLLSSVMTMVKSVSSMPSEIRYGSLLERDEEGMVVGATPRNMIAFANSLVDLDELIERGPENAIHEHTPDWWSLVSLPYEYDPEARIGPYWTRFLAMNLGGDAKLIACLQEWMGYCLMPNTDHQKFLMMIGEGSNGKSVFCAVLEALLGEQNVSHVPLELFGQRFALGLTLGRLANIATETSTLDKVSEGYLKQFTDGSTMMFDRKGLPAIEARPTAKLVLATNRPPRFSDKSMGLWRRMLIAPFEVEIKADDRILGLDRPEWWLERGELPGIFNWTLEGLSRLQIDREFTTPDSSEVAKESLRQDNSPAREFVSESFLFEKGHHVFRKPVYDAYRKFCEAHGYKALGFRAFNKEFASAIPGAKVVKRGSRGEQQSAWLNAVEHVRYSTIEGVDNSLEG